MQRNPNEHVKCRRTIIKYTFAKENGDIQDENVYLDANDYEEFEATLPNMDVNFEKMVENYFAKVGKTHQHFKEDKERVLGSENMSLKDDKLDIYTKPLTT